LILFEVLELRILEKKSIYFENNLNYLGRFDTSVANGELLLKCVKKLYKKIYQTI